MAAAAVRIDMLAAQRVDSAFRSGPSFQRLVHTIHTPYFIYEASLT